MQHNQGGCVFAACAVTTRQPRRSPDMPTWIEICSHDTTYLLRALNVCHLTRGIQKHTVCVVLLYFEYLAWLVFISHKDICQSTQGSLLYTPANCCGVTQGIENNVQCFRKEGSCWHVCFSYLSHLNDFNTNKYCMNTKCSHIEGLLQLKRFSPPQLCPISKVNS